MRIETIVVAAFAGIIWAGQTVGIILVVLAACKILGLWP